MASIFFITGPCGVGKSSIINILKADDLLSSFEIYDFDDVGVPENPSVEWRQETTKYWLEVSERNEKKDISTVVCGLTIPKEVESFMVDTLWGSVCIFLLDVSIKEREKRLKLRGASKELIDDVEEVIELRSWVPNSNLRERNIIDTTNMTIQEVAEEVKKIYTSGRIR